MTEKTYPRPRTGDLLRSVDTKRMGTSINQYEKKTVFPVQQKLEQRLENKDMGQLFGFSLEPTKSTTKIRVIAPPQSICRMQREFDPMISNIVMTEGIFEVKTIRTLNLFVGLYETWIKWKEMTYYMSSYNSQKEAIGGHKHYCDCVKKYTDKWISYPVPKHV